MNREQGIPSNLNPASKEMISDSVELCETEVCFLHIQLIGTNVWLPKIHNVPPEVDFESSRSPAKSESWNSPSLHCLAVLPTWQYCLYSHVWWMYEINRFRHLSQALVHFVIDLASLFTDHRISGLPIRAKYQHLRTIWEHTCDNSPTNFNSSSLKWLVVIDAWSRYFVELLSRLVCQLTISLHTFLHDPPYHKTMKKYEDFEEMEAFLVSCGNLRTQSWFCNCPQYLCLFRFVFDCSPRIHHPRKMLVLPNRLLWWVVSASNQDFVSFQPVLCHPHTQIKIILFHDVQRDIILIRPWPLQCTQSGVAFVPEVMLPVPLRTTFSRSGFNFNHRLVSYGVRSKTSSMFFQQKPEKLSRMHSIPGRKLTFITPWPSWQKFFNSSSGLQECMYRTPEKNQSSSFHVRLDLSCWYLFHQLAFHQSLWNGESRFPEACVSLWETDLQNLLNHT